VKTFSIESELCAIASICDGADVVILHNMTAECHAARAHACRDWLDRFDDTLRFVIVAGCDPYTFSHTRLFCPLFCPLDDFLYLEGELREDVQH
jgi:hypothetical protein